MKKEEFDHILTLLESALPYVTDEMLAFDIREAIKEARTK